MNVAYIHEEIVGKVKNKMPEDEMLYDLAELFKVFGDTTRIKILYALFEEEMCVCDIADLIKYDSISNISSTKSIKTSKISEI